MHGAATHLAPIDEMISLHEPQRAVWAYLWPDERNFSRTL